MIQSQPNYRMWLARESWTTKEAACLFGELNPEKANIYGVMKNHIEVPYGKEYIKELYDICLTMQPYPKRPFSWIEEFLEKCLPIPEQLWTAFQPIFLNGSASKPHLLTEYPQITKNINSNLGHMKESLMLTDFNQKQIPPIPTLNDERLRDLGKKVKDSMKRGGKIAAENRTSRAREKWRPILARAYEYAKKNPLHYTASNIARNLKKEFPNIASDFFRKKISADTKIKPLLKSRRQN